MEKLRPLLIAAAVVVLPLAAGADDQVSATAKPAVEPAATPAPEKTPVTFNGMVDSYGTFNLTQSQAVSNPLRAHDGPTGFHLNWAKLSAAMEPKPAGFRIDVGFGPESTYTTNFLVLQAFASLAAGPGVLDFGQFTTSAGFELFESKDNWLYTRGLIYQFIVPTVHQGIRYTMPVVDGLQLQTSLTNGWDSPDGAIISSENSSYKTGQASLFYAKDAASGAVTVYYGRQPDATDDRLLVDGNVGYHFGPLETNLSASYRTEGDTDTRWGAGVMARYSITEKVRTAARFEYLKDKKGAALGIPDADAWNLTGNVSYLVGANAELRAELRYDAVSEDYFPKTGSATPELTDNAATFHLAAIAWF